MEKIIQIAAISAWTVMCLTNEGRIFKRTGERDWIEAPLPPLHTDEKDDSEIPMFQGTKKRLDDLSPRFSNCL